MSSLGVIDLIRGILSISKGSLFYYKFDLRAYFWYTIIILKVR